MKALRYLALTALLAVVAFLGTLRVAVWLDYWERKHRPADPHLTTPNGSRSLTQQMALYNRWGDRAQHWTAAEWAAREFIVPEGGLAVDFTVRDPGPPRSAP